MASSRGNSFIRKHPAWRMQALVHLDPYSSPASHDDISRVEDDITTERRFAVLSIPGFINSHSYQQGLEPGDNNGARLFAISICVDVWQLAP